MDGGAHCGIAYAEGDGVMRTAGSLASHATQTTYANLVGPSSGEYIESMRAGAETLSEMVERFNRSRDPADAEAIACQAHGIERAAQRARAAAVLEGLANGKP